MQTSNSYSNCTCKSLIVTVSHNLILIKKNMMFFHHTNMVINVWVGHCQVTIYCAPLGEQTNYCYGWSASHKFCTWTVSLLYVFAYGCPSVICRNTDDCSMDTDKLASFVQPLPGHLIHRPSYLQLQNETKSKFNHLLDAFANTKSFKTLLYFFFSCHFTYKS